MGKDTTESGDKERTVNFALLIRATISKDNKITFQMESQNQGIADSEIILAVEAWLDKVRENHKKRITDSLRFGKGDPNPSQ